LVGGQTSVFACLAEFGRQTMAAYVGAVHRCPSDGAVHGRYHPYTNVVLNDGDLCTCVRTSGERSSRERSRGEITDCAWKGTAFRTCGCGHGTACEHKADLEVPSGTLPPQPV